MTQAKSRPPTYLNSFYVAQAKRERNEGDASMLGNVRAKHHLAAEAWHNLAVRVDAGSLASAYRAADAVTLIALPNENPDRIDR